MLAVTLALATLTVVLAAPAGAQDPPLRVLILGDSYSAGNGAGVPEPNVTTSISPSQ